MKNLVKYFCILIAALLPVTLSAQRGGEATYMLLHLTHSSKIASLGGNQVGVAGNDLSILLHNPALLDSAFTKQISISYVPYLADISYGYAGGAWHFEGIGTFALGFGHIGYGDFIAADESGVQTGSFSAGESMIQISYSRRLNRHFTAGASLKPVFSRIEGYSSWGIAGDLGLRYESNNKLFNAGISLRNFGRQISSYSSAPAESLPADLQIGLSQKLAHAPFRLSLSAQDLLSGALSYTLKETDRPGTAYENDKENNAEKVLRHLTFGLEFIPSNNFYIAGGLNPRRRADLKTESKASTVGFTWGFGFKVYKFNFAYASGRYHLAGTSNHFTVSKIGRAHV